MTLLPRAAPAYRSGGTSVEIWFLVLYGTRNNPSKFSTQLETHDPRSAHQILHYMEILCIKVVSCTVVDGARPWSPLIIVAMLS